MTVSDHDLEAYRSELQQVCRDKYSSIVPVYAKQFPGPTMQAAIAFFMTDDGKALTDALARSDEWVRNREQAVRGELYREIVKQEKVPFSVPPNAPAHADPDPDKMELVESYLTTSGTFDRFFSWCTGSQSMSARRPKEEVEQLKASIRDKYLYKYVGSVGVIIEPRLTMATLRVAIAFLKTPGGKDYVACMALADSDFQVINSDFLQTIGTLTQIKLKALKTTSDDPADAQRAKSARSAANDF